MTVVAKIEDLAMLTSMQVEFGALSEAPSAAGDEPGFKPDVMLVWPTENDAPELIDRVLDRVVDYDDPAPEKIIRNAQRDVELHQRHQPRRRAQS